jgi:hypothetical protein
MESTFHGRSGCKMCLNSLSTFLSFLTEFQGLWDMQSSIQLNSINVNLSDSRNPFLFLAISQIAVEYAHFGYGLLFLLRLIGSKISSMFRPCLTVCPGMWGHVIFPKQLSNMFIFDMDSYSCSK